jgi:multidrug efflux pump subunit AcrA (membrane-fusion protein)
MYNTGIPYVQAPQAAYPQNKPALTADEINMLRKSHLNPSKLDMTVEPIEITISQCNHHDQNGVDVISWNKAYVTYAQQIVRAEAREFLSGFTIAEIASSRETINTQLSQRLTKSINEKTPFQVRYVGLADIQYPKIIVEAQENAAERREKVQQEEAQLQISKVQLERQLQEQQLQRKVDVEKAMAEAEVARIQSQSLTPAYIRYRELQILEKLAESDNKVFVPSAMLDSVAGQVQLGRQ